MKHLDTYENITIPYETMQIIIGSVHVKRKEGDSDCLFYLLRHLYYYEFEGNRGYNWNEMHYDYLERNYEKTLLDKQNGKPIYKREKYIPYCRKVLKL